MKNICEWNNCNEEGLYKAPKEKDNSKEYRLLCLEHVKEFNKRKITSILNFMKSDKKNKSDSINLILIRNFGKLNLNYQAKSGELNKFLLKELNKAYL